MEDVYKCEVDGKTFYEGQRFDPPGEQCKTCICQEGFDGKYEAPFCEPVTCTSELLQPVDFRKFCAPVYYGSGSCCPIQWQCSKDKVLHVTLMGEYFRGLKIVYCLINYAIII